MTISNWKPNAGTVQGFFDLELPSGLLIIGMKLISGKNGLFCAFPQRPYQSNGETKYADIVKIQDRATSDKFNSLVIEALKSQGHI